MTSLIRQMERDRLVERRPDPTDGRATTVVLTRRGRAFQPVAERTLAELDELVSDAVPRPALETTRAVLKELMRL